jgi:spore germination protein KC
MKKAVLLLILLATLLSGCEKSFDINERVIVQGVGIDCSENGFEITVQTLNTDSYSGIGGAKVPESLVNNYYLSGKTVADALSKLAAAAGKRPLFTHTRIILIGDEQAKRGLESVLDFFTRDSNCHTELFVAACSDTAKKTLTANTGKESIPAVEIENIIKASENSPDWICVRIYDLVKMRLEKTSSFYLPVISVFDGSKGEQTVSVTKTAVFKGDKLYNFIDSNQTVYLSIFTNTVKSGSYTLENFRYGNASFDFYYSKCKTDVFIDVKGTVTFNVRLKCVFDCVEFANSNVTKLNGDILGEMETALENQLSQKMKSFLQYMCNEGTDCMRLGRILLLKNQNAYKQLEDDWENSLNQIKITVTSEATVRRTGQES